MTIITEDDFSTVSAKVLGELKGSAPLQFNDPLARYHPVSLENQEVRIVSEGSMPLPTNNPLTYSLPISSRFEEIFVELVGTDTAGSKGYLNLSINTATLKITARAA